MSDQISVFAPASVSNVACGFDTLGFALEGLGDIVSAGVREEPGVEIVAIDGDGGLLPRETPRNTAGRAAQAVLARAPEGAGVTLRIDKQMPLSSGIGSSAASAVAAAVAVERLFDLALSQEELLRCALAGELVASGALHGDNVAPSLLGGFVLVRSLEPEVDVVPLPVPEGLYCGLARPHLIIDTDEARRRLPPELPLRQAVIQWGNLGALVAALHQGDFELLGRALHDEVSEPVRSQQVPGFAAARRAALEQGALGCSLSGSGPALFALCRGQAAAELSAEAMARVLRHAAGVDCDQLVSRVGVPGARRI